MGTCFGKPPFYQQIISGYSGFLGVPTSFSLAADARTMLLRANLPYMEYHGDLVRHSLLRYWYEVGTKFDDCSKIFDEIDTKYNPEVIKHRPL